MEVNMSPEQEISKRCECCGNHPAVLRIMCNETITSAEVCVNCIGSAFLLSIQHINSLKDDEAHQAKEVARCLEVIFNEISSIVMGAVQENRNANKG